MKFVSAKAISAAGSTQQIHKGGPAKQELESYLAPAVAAPCTVPW
jgi:hypothetical protein